jgi:hypothetical protein
MKLPRVSQIIAPYSGYHKVPRKILEKAADRGTVIHAACLAMVKKEEFKLTADYANYVISFAKFLPKITEVISYETRYDDEEWGYTGMFDYLGRVDGYPGMTLFDIKTSYSTKKIWGCQLAAYARLVMKHVEAIPETLMVVHLSKEGKAPTLIKYELTENLDRFRQMCEMYHEYKPDAEEFIYD